MNPTRTPPKMIETPEPSAAEDEAPLLSANLEVVTDVFARRGFSPDVYFEYDDSSLSDEVRDRLARNADLLRSQPQFAVTIEGHTDERGTNEHNLALGDRRANGVREYLIALGIDGSRLRSISYGKERPVCTESDERCWSQNRRAHMVITGRSGVL
jgi:peptidoglycan-associated lipoprotein